MEDPPFIRSDRSRARRRLWLMTALLVVATACLGDQIRQRRTAGPPEPKAKNHVVAHTVPPLLPSVRINAQYLRQVRQTRHLYHPIIERVSRRYAVDPALVKAIIMAESAYNPKAVSHRGALGLMQLMPTTAQSLGVADSFNPEHNITAGVRYFRQLMNLVENDPTLALAAYNAGPQKVRRYNGIPPFKATHRYVEKVMAYYHCYRSMRLTESLSGQV